MASKNMSLVLVLAVAMFWSGAAAQSSTCTNVLMTLSPCLNYITGNTSTPSSGCCSQLATIVTSQPQCLCEALTADTSSLGLNINTTQAMTLPAACNVQTPPLAACNADSPAGSPPGSANSDPTGRGSNTVPSTQSDGSSDASSTKISSSMLFLLLVATSYVASFTMH